MTWTKQQIVSGNNGAAATTSVAGTLASTQVGSLLIALVSCAIAGATITPPVGWVQIGTTQPTNPSGGSVALFRFENNPGAITTVTFTITSSLAAVILAEYLGSPNLGKSAVDTFIGYANSNGTFEGFSNSSFLASESSDLVISGIGFIINAAPTDSGLSGGWTLEATSISTAASGNACAMLFDCLNAQNNGNYNNGVLSPSRFSTLSATPTNGPSGVAVTFLAFLLLPNNGMAGPAAETIGYRSGGI